MKTQAYIPKTFQRKIILYNLMIVIAIASVISYYNFTSYKNDTIEIETRNSQNTIQLLSERLDLAYQEMINLLLNCSERQSQFFSSYSISDNSYMELNASKVLKDYCAISGYSEYIFRLSLYDKDRFFLQAGSLSGSSTDLEYVMSSPWFQERLHLNTNQYALTLVDNPFPIGRGSTPKIFPLVRPLNYRYGQAPEDSWVFLAISPKLYTDALQSLDGDRLLYAACADNAIITSPAEDPFDGEAVASYLNGLEATDGSVRLTLNQEPVVVSYHKHSVSGILLFEILPISSIIIDRQVVVRTITIIFFFCLVIGLGLSYLISRQLGRPILRLINRLDQIAKGDFKPDPTIESNDEIGIIGRHINQMSGHINTLIETRIQGEKEKKDLELKMLQAQINPHFLYNTLDSIKWIATIQKNSGIVQTVTSLSSLLKNMAKGFNEKVTLQQELDFLNDYVIIEKVRYVEMFDIDIQVDSPELYQAQIIKLTLQPLVENAIFNGIEPSGRIGLIQIHAWSENGILKVSVRDNGIGMSEEQCKKILTDTSRITKSTMSGIGLPNVDRRIKLVYGDEYGLIITSELDKYTQITISIPLENLQ